MRGGQEGWADAPTLEADDVAAWNFYQQEATPFAREFGLMDVRIAELSFDGVARSIFVAKLSAIHNAMTDHAERKAKEAGEDKPEPFAEGDENG